MVEINLTSETTPTEPVVGVKPLNSMGEPAEKSKLPKLLFFLVIAGAGIITGYFLSNRNRVGGLIGGGQLGGISGEVKKGTKVGLSDESTFKDTAEGELVAGGVDGEGSHHLERPGGESQNVYLTSSAIDLNQFVGRQVRVWGETFSAQTAGWLMDVGKLEVLE